MESGNKKAVGEVCRPAQQLQGKNHEPNHDSESNNSTNNSQSQSSQALVTDQKTAETAALNLLREAGFIYPQQLDWISKAGDLGYWQILEIKYKTEFYQPPPFPGLGIDFSQVFLREQLRFFFGIRTFLIIYCEQEIYAQFLDKLLTVNVHRTPNNILIYPIPAFIVGRDAILNTLKNLVVKATRDVQHD